MSYLKVVPIKRKKKRLASCLSLKQDGGAIKYFHLLLLPGLAESLEVAATTFIKQHYYFSLVIVEQTKFGKLGFLP